MKNLPKYIKAFGDIITKPLFIVVGITALIVGLGNITVTITVLKQVATVFGAICLVLGLAEPLYLYAKDAVANAKGNK